MRLCAIQMHIFNRLKILRQKPYELAALILSLSINGGAVYGIGEFTTTYKIGENLLNREEKEHHVIQVIPMASEMLIPAAAKKLSISSDVKDVKKLKTSPEIVERTDLSEASPQFTLSNTIQPLFPILPSFEIHYFLTEELSQPPVLVEDVSPPKNLILTRLRLQTAVLKLFVNDRGGIDDLIVEESELTDDAAQILKSAFSELKFTPGVIDGRAVNSQMKIEVRLGG